MAHVTRRQGQEQRAGAEARHALCSDAVVAHHAGCIMFSPLGSRHAVLPLRHHRLPILVQPLEGLCSRLDLEACSLSLGSVHRQALLCHSTLSGGPALQTPRACKAFNKLTLFQYLSALLNSSNKAYVTFNAVEISPLHCRPLFFPFVWPGCIEQ